MTAIEDLQAARVHLAQVYVDAAVRLAKAAKTDPLSNLRGHFTACTVAWRALCDIDNGIQRLTFAGDPIDDFYREGAARAGGNEAP